MFVQSVNAMLAATAFTPVSRICLGFMLDLPLVRLPEWEGELLVDLPN